MKYIMFEDFAGHPLPILFPDRIRHEEMREQMPYGTILSAGYVSLGPGGMRCYGESKALGAQAREMDAALMAEHFAA